MIDWLSSGVSAKNWTHGRFIPQLEDLSSFNHQTCGFKLGITNNAGGRTDIISKYLSLSPSPSPRVSNISNNIDPENWDFIWFNHQQSWNQAWIMGKSTANTPLPHWTPSAPKFCKLINYQFCSFNPIYSQSFLVKSHLDPHDLSMKSRAKRDASMLSTSCPSMVREATSRANDTVGANTYCPPLQLGDSGTVWHHDKISLKSNENHRVIMGNWELPS